MIARLSPIMVSIDRVVVVRGGALKRSPWHISHVESIDDPDLAPSHREFILLSKSDQGFSRFVTGDPKGLQKLGWLDILKRLRNEACERAVAEKNSVGLFEDAPPPTKRKRARVPHPPKHV